MVSSRKRKFNEKEIEKIKALWAGGATYQEIMKATGKSKSAVYEYKPDGEQNNAVVQAARTAALSGHWVKVTDLTHVLGGSFTLPASQVLELALQNNNDKLLKGADGYWAPRLRLEQPDLYEQVEAHRQNLWERVREWDNVLINLRRTQEKLVQSLRASEQLKMWPKLPPDVDELETLIGITQVYVPMMLYQAYAYLLRPTPPDMTMHYSITNPIYIVDRLPKKRSSQASYRIEDGQILWTDTSRLRLCWHERLGQNTAITLAYTNSREEARDLRQLHVDQSLNLRVDESFQRWLKVFNRVNKLASNIDLLLSSYRQVASVAPLCEECKALTFAGDGYHTYR